MAPATAATTSILGIFRPPFILVRAELFVPIVLANARVCLRIDAQFQRSAAAERRAGL
jgi:hypothetical protein